MPKKRFKINVYILFAAILVFLALGSLLYTHLEGWSFVDAFYFATITATTVGYGDLTPTHELSKVITVIYSLSIVPFVLYTMSIVAQYQVERVYSRVHRVDRQHEEKLEQLAKTDIKLKKVIDKQEDINEVQEKEIDLQAEELEMVEGLVKKKLKSHAKKH